MALQNKLRKMLHPKRWETRTNVPANTAAGSFVVSDKFDLVNDSKAFYVQSASAIYMYEADEDSCLQLPASGIAGVFAAGACGEFRALSACGGIFIQSASGGSTTAINTALNINRSVAGMRIRVVAGAGLGYDEAITRNTLGANAVLTVPVNGVAFNATTKFQIFGGSLWFFNAGTSAVGYSVYDRITNVWTSRSVTGLPTAWATDGQLVSTIGSAKQFATGNATAGGASSLTNAGKAWGVNMWANAYQLRITGGTGKGQIRGIASNTATAITVDAVWEINPDATSTYAIEGNSDYFYLFGNNAVTAYRFKVSTNVWNTLAPGAARAGAMAAGGTANWIDSAQDWDNETLVQHNQASTLYRQNGRYIVSFRGGASSNLDFLDLAAVTWISTVAYGNQAETFTTGSSSCDLNGNIFIHKESSGRVYRFDVAKNMLTSHTWNVQPQGAVLAGNKMFIMPFVDGVDKLQFLYQISHTSNILQRQMLI